MAEVNLGPRRFVLTEDPKQRITQAERAAPWVALGKGLERAGEGLEDIAVAQAKEEGAKSVSMDADGNPVAAPPMSAFFGRRAAEYNKHAQIAYFAEAQRKYGTVLLETAKENEGKPDAFRAGANAIRDKTLAGLPAHMVEPARQWFSDQIEQHYRGLMTRQFNRDVARNNDSLDAARVRLEREMSSLAASGGTGTPEYAAKRAEYAALGRQIVANPLTGISQERWQVWADAQEEKDIVGALAVTAQKFFEENGRDLAATDKWVREQLARPELQIDALKQARYAKQIETVVRGSAAVSAQEKKEAIEASGKVRERIAQGWNIEADEIYENVANLKRVGALGEAARLQREYENGRDAPALKGRDTRAAIGALTGGGNVTPELGAAIGAAARQYGVPAAFLSRLAEIESSGGRNLVNPNSSARGPFQFMPGTWAQYGAGGDRMSATDSAAAAARLTQANARVLRNALGREPTWGELYLAHQQGAGGASALLTNPGMRAADLVGADAVRLNGGTAGMSAGDFASLWTRKFGGGSGLGQADAPSVGVPNPAMWRQRQKQFDEGTNAYNTEVLKAGIGNATQDEYAELAERLQYVRDGDLRRRIEEHLTLAQAMGKFKGLPWDEQQRAVAEMEAALVSGELGPLGREALNAAKPQAAAATKRFVERATPLVDNAAADPVTAAAAMRAVKKAVKPDEVSKVQTRFDARFRAMLTDFDTSTKEGQATPQEFGRLTVLAPYVADIDLREKFQRLSTAREAKAEVAGFPLAEQQQIAESLDVALRGGAVPAALRPAKEALDNLVKGNTAAFVKQALPVVDNAAANPVLAAAMVAKAKEISPDDTKEVQTRYDARVRAIVADIENPKAGKPTQNELVTLTVLSPQIGDIDLAEKVQRILTTNVVVAQQAGMPVAAAQQVGAELQVRAEAGEAFPIQRAVTAAWNAQADAKDKLLAADPVTFWRNEHSMTPAPAPLDFANPDALKAAMLERQHIANLARAANEGSEVGGPLNEREVAAVVQQIRTGNPTVLGNILGGLAVLDKPNRDALFADKKLVEPLLGAATGVNPTRAAVAVSFMERWHRADPIGFDKAFGAKGLTAVQDWEWEKDYLSEEQRAKRREEMLSLSPQAAAVRKERLSEAKTKSAAIDERDILYGLGNTWNTPGAPPTWENAATAGATNGAMVQDFRRLFAERYAVTGDEARSKKDAIEHMRRVWGPSAANGGRIMKFPPELKVPKVDDSHDFLRRDLDRFVYGVLGSDRQARIDAAAMGAPVAPQRPRVPATPEEASRMRLEGLPPGIDATKGITLVADRETETGWAAGRPSYLVVVFDNNGMAVPLPYRWTPDADMAKLEASARAATLRDARGDAEMRARRFRQQLITPAPVQGTMP
jgi:hypothetical protein